MKIITRILLIVPIILCFTIGISAATFAVNTTDDTGDPMLGNGVCADSNNHCSLRAAISEANFVPGADTIILPAGIYTQTLTTASNEDINTGGDWDITGDLTIIGAGQDVTILQAAATPDTATEGVLESPLVTDPPTVVITGVTIRHGKKTGTNISQQGGGIRNYGGDMTINDSTITLNRGTTGGGIYNRGNITLNNVIVSNNTCDRESTTCFGGGMYNSFSFTGTKNITINGSTFTSNTAVASGLVAQVYAAGFGAESTIDNGMVINISNSSFTNNQGNAVSTSPENGGGNGSGIRIGAQAPSVLNITNTVISGNGIGGGGGTIRGPGMSISSTANLTGTWDKLTVANNTTGNFFGNGIALTANGTPVVNFDIVNSTISGNTGTGAANVGGGLGILANPTSHAVITVNFLNSTISGNTSGGSGGGVYLDNAGTSAVFTANFNFCTIAGNAAATSGGSGGGLDQVGGSTHINVKNSIVADNSAGSGPEISGTITSQNYNHIEDLTGSTFSPMPSDTSGFDPQLGPLQNNGGGTLTQLLSGVSPLVNRIANGANGCGAGGVTTDQRGLARPTMDKCDVGAVELEQFAGGPFSISGTVATEGGIPIRNVVVVLSEGGLSEPRYAVTGSLGNYQFTNVPASGYTVSISSKRFFFAEDGQFVNVPFDRTGINFSGVQQTTRLGIFDIKKR
ncbi:MAG TPA: carboxypeptidase-like regulatory domain-containing protein [Pyrinomonadaceae bacterium]|jgi:CSLREA domain-containing protein|nr:carboxypeptidase-like regulatory domain-containing protein [Pyrinomonadaceae bacterium]